MSPPALAETIERLRITLRFGFAEWIDLLGLTKEEYFRVRTHRLDFSSRSLVNLADFLKLDPSRILEGTLDYKGLLLSHGRCLANPALPERYSNAAFSKRRTSINVLDYVEEFHGWRAHRAILDHFGMVETHFSNPDRPISIQFLTDLTRLLRERKITDFYSMGAYSVVSNQTGALGNAFSTVTKPIEIYQRMFGDLLPYYERNHHYFILGLDEDRCLVEVCSNLDVADALGLYHLGSSDVCNYRAGVMASAPGYMGLPAAEVTEVACVHRGDISCKFEINLAFSNFVASQLSPS